MTEQNRIWDNYKMIKTVRKSDRIVYGVAAAVRDGVRYLNIREFYYKRRNGTWKPGRDGITVPLKHPIEFGTKMLDPYNELVAAMAEAMQVAATMPIYDKNGAVYGPKPRPRVSKKEAVNENK